MNKKETRGGTRDGSGAQPKYDEPTKTIKFYDYEKTTSIFIIVNSINGKRIVLSSINSST
jgi:hypothetical protein